jgi:hypothetical protein
MLYTNCSNCLRFFHRRCLPEIQKLHNLCPMSIHLELSHHSKDKLIPTLKARCMFVGLKPMHCITYHVNGSCRDPETRWNLIHGEICCAFVYRNSSITSIKGGEIHFRKPMVSSIILISSKMSSIRSIRARMRVYHLSRSLTGIRGWLCGLMLQTCRWWWHPRTWTHYSGVRLR